MRRFIKTTTLSALLLSIVAGGALAASGAASDSTSGDYYEGIDPHATSPAPAPMMMPSAVSAPSGIHRVVAEGPRLRHVLAELRTDDRRIGADRREGKMTATASNSVRREEADIRAQAIAVADRHDGVIPNRNYHRIVQEMHKLNQDIVRLS
ncbi:hypothetical protein ACFFP0_02990 [Rhizobium puerariae]|uniref:DUF4168 domain-containing protein n=1 Tax=Rhizobium puerariae TaxID=1585791 RepID=A0ABV6AAZ2_9HYPH